MTPIEQAIRHKPNSKKVLKFSTVVWVRIKDAGKLESQAAKEHFVGYDEESKGFCMYFSKHQSVIIKHDMYFDNGAVVDVGDVMFEGETESNTAPAGFSNPNTPTNAPRISAHDP